MIRGGSIRDECPLAVEARSCREIASQLARAANESSFTQVHPPRTLCPRRGARSLGGSLFLGLIAISLGEIASVGNQDTVRQTRRLRQRHYAPDTGGWREKGRESRTVCYCCASREDKNLCTRSGVRCF